MFKNIFLCYTTTSWHTFSASAEQKLLKAGRLFTKIHTHTHPFNGPLSGTTQVGRYQKGKTKLDFTEAKDSEWQWHQLGHMQVCTALQTDNHASTPPLSFLQAGCPSWPPNQQHQSTKDSCLLRSVY